MLDKKIILFIDDNPGDRRLVSCILTKCDFNVLLAEDGDRGLKIAQEEKPGHPGYSRYFSHRHGYSQTLD